VFALASLTVGEALFAKLILANGCHDALLREIDVDLPRPGLAAQTEPLGDALGGLWATGSALRWVGVLAGARVGPHGIEGP
jgi:hypothetical protein